MMELWSAEWKQHQLDQLYEDWKKCDRCPLVETRHKVVFGEGNPDADILFIGEGPGEEEDKVGRPFIGESGQLFTALWESLDQHRGDSYVTNIVGCRPPENRNPTKIEKEACLPRLHEIIYIIDPLLIVTLGKVALNALVGGRQWGIETSHGKLFSSPHPDVRVTDEKNGIHIHGRVFPRTGDDKKKYTLEYDCIPLFHPAYILRVDSYDHEKDEFEKGGVAHKTLDDMRVVISQIQQLKNEYGSIQKVL
jgi:DNA polymerase